MSEEDHFKGKSVLEHLREARARGTLATAEVHGTELAGYLSAGLDSAKESSVIFLMLWILLPNFSLPLFCMFSLGWAVWKTGRSAMLGWSRLERLHRVIEEERWEIEHHREQEKKELRELYEVKGLSGKLLDDVITVFMADDNRVLRIMLEEELGLSLETYEHPLKQSAGALVGVGMAFLSFLGFWRLLPSFGPLIGSGLIILASSFITTKLQKNRLIEALIWNLSLAAFASGMVYFLKQL